MKTKTFGPWTFKIDRPAGSTKTWSGGKAFTYPCDYGLWPKLLGEDGEGLDAFVGDDPSGHLESFQKLKPGPDGRLVPDETKFLLGVTDAQRAKIYALYGEEVNARRVYANFAEVNDALEKFPAKRRKSAAFAYGYHHAKLAASVFDLLNRVPTDYAASQFHTPAQIYAMARTRPALAGTQANLRTMNEER